MTCVFYCNTLESQKSYFLENIIVYLGDICFISLSQLSATPEKRLSVICVEHAQCGLWEARSSPVLCATL